MSYENYLQRKRRRQELTDNGFRIANEIELAILKFVHSKRNERYPSQHYNSILNHLEEDCELLVPGYDSIDACRSIIHSLYERGMLSSCCDSHHDSNLPDERTSGYRIPDISVVDLITDK